MDTEFRVKSVESTGDKVPSAIFRIEEVAPKLAGHAKQNAKSSTYSASLKKQQEGKINEGGIKRRLRNAMRKKGQEAVARKQPKRAKHRAFYKNSKRTSERRKKNRTPFTEQRLASSAKGSLRAEPAMAAVLKNTGNLPIIVRPIFKFLRTKQ